MGNANPKGLRRHDTIDLGSSHCGSDSPGRTARGRRSRERPIVSSAKAGSHSRVSRSMSVAQAGNFA
jgi:hypothetical protein